MFNKPVDLAGAAAFIAFMAVLPLIFPGNYLIGVLTVSVIYGIWAVSWDFMSGLTGRENFGHSLFIGVGAYTAAFLAVKLGISPWLTLLVGIALYIVFSELIGGI